MVWLTNGEISGLSTGFTRLNKITSGLQKSNLIILAARPGIGKTAFGLNIAKNVALEEQKPVAFFSLGMSYAQLFKRFLTVETSIDPNGLLKAGFISQEDWQEGIDAGSILDGLPVFIDDTPNITVMDVRAKARKLYQKHGDLGLVIIDYLQLMKAPFNFDRKGFEFSEISWGLKALAKELDIPVMALSQINRMLEQRDDKRPLMSDLRCSRALEQHADIIAFMYRDEVYNKEQDNPKKGTTEIIVAKNRNGVIGTVLMHFYKQHTQFEELTPGN
jgi:replicative DNA helicase